jgi:ribosomal protein S18 acetylase RimI-like enzyme
MIERKAFAPYRKWDAEGFRRRIDNPNAIVLKGTLGGNVVGKVVGIVYHGSKNKSLQVQDVSVLPKYRGNGVASKLLLALEERGQKKGCIYSALHVRPNNWVAKRLYTRLGYSNMHSCSWAEMDRMRKDFNGV